MPHSSRDPIRVGLEAVYRTYNKRDHISPDPLELVYRYRTKADREVVGLIAASLAFGNVSQILRSAGRVLEQIQSPALYVTESSRDALAKAFRGFRHRYVDERHLVELLAGIGRVLREHGSLRACFLAGLADDAPSTLSALGSFTGALQTGSSLAANYLIPSTKSACKRLHMFLRWMGRSDEVDPGVWHPFPARKLLVPLDTHMYRAALALGFTRRRQADWRTVVEVTEAFRAYAPDDPVRYDFALTRIGIWRMPSNDPLVAALFGPKKPIAAKED